MPKLSQYTLKLRQEKIKEVVKWRNRGLSYREIGRIMKKSHEWARQMVLIHRLNLTARKK